MSGIIHIIDFIPGILALIFMAALLLKSKRRVRPQRWMVLVLGILGGLWLILPMYYWASPRHMLVFNTIYTGCVMGLPLSYICFIRSLTSTKNIQRGNLIIVAIWGLMLAVLFTLMIDMNQVQRNNYMKFVVMDQSDPDAASYGILMNSAVRLYKSLIIPLWALVIFWSEIRLRNYSRMLADYYAHEDGHRLWQNQIFSALGIVTLIMVILTFRARRSSTLTGMHIMAWVSQVIVVCGYGLVAFKTRFSAERLSQWDDLYGHTTQFAERKTLAERSKAEYDNQQFEMIGKGLHTAIENRFYTHYDITLPALADQIGTSPRYLKDYILFTTQASFSDYVNSHRVEYAKILLQEDPEMVLAEVARRSGFRNEKSMRKCFSAFTGMAPEEWAGIHNTKQ